MRILVLKINDIGRVASEQYLFTRKLSKYADVIFYGPGYDSFAIDELDITKVTGIFNPDVLLLNDFWRGEKLDVPWINLDKVNLLKCMYPVDDPHSQANVRIRWYNENKIDLLLSPLYHEVQSWRKKLNGELLFLPHSVDIETFYPREKTIDASFLGETSKVSYPFRYKIAEYLSTSKEIKGYYHKRPGYGIYGRTIGEQLLKNYCSVLGNSKLFVFDVGIFKRPYLKFLEALASKALPLAPIPYDIKKYHLEPDLDFGIIDENNFKDKIRYYIDNEKERLEMTEHGYQKVLKYHSMDIRVKEFLKIVEERI